MGLFSGMLEKRTHPRDPALAKFLGVNAETASGIDVTEETALNFSAVFRAVDLLGKHIGMLPLHLMERTGENAKRKATRHPLYNLLYLKPNPSMTAFNWRHLLMTHVLLWGNSYNGIEWSNGGQPIALWPLRPDKMRVTRENGVIWYYYGRPEKRMPASDVLHIRGLTTNGVIGKSVIAGARDDIGLGVAARQYGGRFFKNDAQSGAVLQHPGRLSDEAYTNLKNSFSNEYAGVDNSHKTKILEEGMTIESIGIPPVDAQFLQTRKFQITEIARWFGVPSHKLNDLEQATFSNIEHQSIEYVQDALQPWATNIEQAIDTTLLTSTQRKKYYSKLNLSALLRGDSTARHEAYASGIQWGYYSINDVLELEDMNPVDGGDTRLTPMNMAPLGQLPATQPQQNALPAQSEQRSYKPAEYRQWIAKSQEKILREALGRVLRREANDIGNKLPKWTNLDADMDAFYEDFRGWIIKYMTPSYSSIADLVGKAAADEVDGDVQDLEKWVTAYIEQYAARHIGKSKKQIHSAIEEGDESTAVDDMLTDWRDERPAEEAHNESVRFGNAVAKTTWIALSVRTLIWDARGDACPYCRGLDGKVVAIDKNFLEAGESYQPAGADSPLVSTNAVGHGPAHRGCNCTVRPGKK